MPHLTEKQVGHLLSARGLNEGACTVAADDFQCITNAFGIARELHCRGIGEVFLLLGDG
ncbi:MAG: Uncharacterised protein [Halieaceae bacterium]|jgi:hypothetical protein|nr:MAG: Uncharacterised protein [Halieaceae bacterium]